MTLAEFSEIYIQHSDVYSRFSEGEDYPRLIDCILIPLLKDKVVVEIGCGTGKYSKRFNSIASCYVGVDRALPQLKQAVHKKSTQFDFIQADAQALPFQAGSADVVFSAWCLGSVLDEQMRLRIVNEAKRILKPGGILISVENGINGEFEWIRGRTQDSTQRTRQDHQWFLENHFNQIANVDSFFQFNTQQEAQSIFKMIWNSKVADQIQSNVIQHQIVVFCRSF